MQTSFAEDTPVMMLLFTDSVLGWGRDNMRSFFWREQGLSAYECLVVEVLLARTRAETVEDVALRFLETYPNPDSLATADYTELEELLHPLGLFRKRARAFERMGGMLKEEYEGHVPQDLEDLRRLPYVGRYAANAILCFCFGERRAIVDANVARIFQRYFGLEAPTSKLENEEGYWQLAESLLPDRDVRLYNWSLLDLGAQICAPQNPMHEECPLSTTCTEISV